MLLSFFLWRVMKRKKTDDYISSSSPKNNLIFIFCVFFLIIINIVNTYSCGVSYAEQLGKPNTFVLLKQIVFVFFGLILGLVFSKLPLNVIKYSSPVFVLATIVVLLLGIVTDFPFIRSQWFLDCVFLSGLIYWSVFFSNRNNKIESFKEMVTPAVFTDIIMFLLLVNSGVGHALGYLFITVLVLGFCGVGLFSILLVVLYSFIPSAVYFLTSPQRVNAVLGFIVPGLFEETTNSMSFLSKAAVSSGELMGRGLGNGQFKYLMGDRILSDYALCNFSEETGFAGVCLLFCLLIFVITICFRQASKIKDERLFESNIICSICSLFIVQILANLALVLGLLPFDGFTFPFLSGGPEIIVLISEFLLLNRCFRNEPIEEDSYRLNENINSQDY